MWSWWFVVALGAVTVDGGGVEEERPIDVAVLLPIAEVHRPFSAVRLRPAVDLGVARASAVLGRRVRVSYGDSRCSAIHGINEAINYYVRGPPNVYFGPVCDYAVSPVARQVYFWNIPVVSVGAVDVDFQVNRRRSYPLLTRAGPVNLVGLTDAILEEMRVFGWRRVTLLYEQDGWSDVIPPFCKLVAGSILHRLDSVAAPRVVQRDYYKFVSTVNFADDLVREVGRKYAGKCDSRV